MQQEKKYSRKQVGFWLGVIIVLALIAGLFDYGNFSFLPNWMKKPFRLGLDLSGGTHAVFEADMSQVSNGERDNTLNGLRDVIERRVNIFGVSEPRVETIKAGDNYRLSVELAGIKDPQEALKAIGEMPFLEFKEERQAAETEAILKKQKEKDPNFLYIDPYFKSVEPALTGRYLKSAQLGTDPQTYEFEVNIKFNEEGAKIFSDLTSKNVGRRIAIYLDGEPISAPTVNMPITDGSARISGNFTVESAKQLVQRLNAGALPVRVKLLSQQTVGATLGGSSLNLMIKAGIVGVVLVVVFMLAFYHLFGLFASLALLIYTSLSLAVFKLLPVTLTLSGVAGFILSIGMAVDANILIFERTKEEMRRGMSKYKAIEEGFRRAWPSIRDSNISSIITCLVLYGFTTSIVKGFALTLLIGVVLSMFTAITVTRSFLRVFVRDRA